LKNRGQTLIELLTAVVIMAIFMTFAIPTLTSVLKHLVVAREISGKLAEQLAGWANMLPAVKPYRYAFAGRAPSYISPVSQVSMLSSSPTNLSPDDYPMKLRSFVFINNSISGGKAYVSARYYEDNRPLLSLSSIVGTPLGTATYPSLSGASISADSYAFLDTDGTPHPFSALALQIDISNSETATVSAVRITSPYLLPYGCLQDTASSSANILVGFTQPVQFDTANIGLAVNVRCFDAAGTDMGTPTLVSNTPILPIDINSDRYYWGIILSYSFTSTSTPVMCRVLFEDTDYIRSYDETTPADFYDRFGYGPALEVAGQCPP